MEIPTKQETQKVLTYLGIQPTELSQTAVRRAEQGELYPLICLLNLGVLLSTEDAKSNPIGIILAKNGHYQELIMLYKHHPEVLLQEGPYNDTVAGYLAKAGYVEDLICFAKSHPSIKEDISVVNNVFQLEGGMNKAARLLKAGYKREEGFRFFLTLESHNITVEQMAQALNSAGAPKQANLLKAERAPA